MTLRSASALAEHTCIILSVPAGKAWLYVPLHAASYSTLFLDYMLQIKILPLQCIINSELLLVTIFPKVKEESQEKKKSGALYVSKMNSTVEPN